MKVLDFKEVKSKFRLFIRGLFYKRIRFLIEYEYAFGKQSGKNACTYITNLNKEEISRSYILENKKNNLNFLDIGSRDGSLRYLLGTKENLKYKQSLYDKNKVIFNEKYNYYGTDIKSLDNETNKQNIIIGDICQKNYLSNKDHLLNFFDVIYSNNVFEHLSNPFIAAENIEKLLKPNGVVITIAPFSIRYHECPSDYYRFSHKGLEQIFKEAGRFETLISGYDILGRRNNWQGTGTANDIVPVDKLGAWRENWFVVNISKKL